MKEKASLGATVSTRLLNQARKTGADYQTLLTSYCLERFLYRLGASDVRERIVLNEAMLLRLWADQPYRATRDLDLLRRGDTEFNAVRADLRAILAASADVHDEALANGFVRWVWPMMVGTLNSELMTLQMRDDRVVNARSLSGARGISEIRSRNCPEEDRRDMVIIPVHRSQGFQHLVFTYSIST